MLHFTRDEFADRLARTRAEMAAQGLDGLLLFSPESQYWLTGYDTFGFCFFQCLVVSESHVALVTRSADLRQAQLTSTIEDVRIWVDREGADPSEDLAALIDDMGLMGKRLGWETDTVGLTHAAGARVAARLDGRATLTDLGRFMGRLRLVKSPQEMVYTRRAADLADAAFERAMEVIAPGVDEAVIQAAMMQEIHMGGGDDLANEIIIGSGEHALLCRYQAGRRALDARDQLSLEWAGAFRHYHAAAFRTVVIGDPRPEHEPMFDAAREALGACEAALKPGATTGEVFDAHARTLDQRGLEAHRLNACGYAMGARFAPCWMEAPMFYAGAEEVVPEGSVFFLHMILMDSDSGTAMCLGRSSFVGPDGAEPLSRLPLEMPPGMSLRWFGALALAGCAAAPQEPTAPPGPQTQSVSSPAPAATPPQASSLERTENVGAPEEAVETEVSVATDPDDPAENARSEDFADTTRLAQRYVVLGKDAVLIVSSPFGAPDRTADLIARAVADALGPPAPNGAASALSAAHVFHLSGQIAAPPDRKFVVDWTVSRADQPTVAAFYTTTRVDRGGWGAINTVTAGMLADDVATQLRLSPPVAAVLEPRRAARPAITLGAPTTSTPRL